MIDTCIFDLDGVIIDNIAYHLWVWQDKLDKFGIKFTKDDFRKFSGMSTREIMEILFKGKDSVDLDGFSKEKDKKANEIIMKRAKIFPGTKELIGKLKKEGFKIALASSSERTYIIKLLKKKNLEKYFDVVVSKDDVRRTKPNPEIFLIAAKKLHSEPSKCLVFEDSENGIKAAKRAKMKCLAIRNEYIKSEVFKCADLIVDSLKDVSLEMIKRL
jgi:beta-phosphoglucomutase family hydrolase